MGQDMTNHDGGQRDERLLQRIGEPRESVTHWGISRLNGAKWERLDYPDDLGMTPKEWPIEELSLDVIKARWASGEFKVHWFELDPQNDDVSQRRRSGGHSSSFKVLPEPTVTIPRAAAAPSSAAAPLPPLPPGADMSSALDFATRLLDMADRRAAQQFDAVARLTGIGPQQSPHASDPAVAELRAEIARFKAEAEARAAREEADRRHRTEIARLERERDEARRAAEEEPDEPAIVAEDGAGFVAQIGAGIGNAIIEAAKKNPELVMGVLGNVLAPMLAKMQNAEAPPPTGVPAPRQVPAPAAPVGPEPMTSNGMPSVPMSKPPVASAAPAAVAAVETTKTGVPITRAANGAPKPSPPAVIDTTGETVQQ
jgi:hypothetical protein